MTNISFIGFGRRAAGLVKEMQLLPRSREIRICGAMDVNFDSARHAAVVFRRGDH